MSGSHPTFYHLLVDLFTQSYWGRKQTERLPIIPVGHLRPQAELVGVCLFGSKNPTSLQSDDWHHRGATDTWGR